MFKVFALSFETPNKTKVALLSQTGRTMLRVVEYFAKVIWNDTVEWGIVCKSIPLKLCLHLVPFPRYSASKNDVTLKPEVGVVQAFKVTENGAVR